MSSSRLKQATKLEDIPNIGTSIAADLRAIGILSPQQLAGRDPFATYVELSGTMEQRHDPCVLYVLMSAQHFLACGEVRRWWTFTEQGKKILADKLKREP
ncbi:MAG: hypothetical protein A2076_03320 [Geobacteraceae bacterium GWC2_53_11]|nr:MAG: hypothetical protein A2076_03320 [Geobacteraceae bacterium GWC2_53_11]